MRPALALVALLAATGAPGTGARNPAELPRGGSSVLPEHRVIGF